MTEKVRAIPSTEVFFDVNEERLYGANTQLEEDKLRSPLSKTFKEMISYFKRKSDLLKLIPNDSVTRGEILNAYKSDVTMVNKAIVEFETFVHDTIRCSIELKKVRTVYDEKAIAWDMIQNTLPELAKSPIVSLGHKRAAKGPAEMLYELQEEYEAGIELMVHRFDYYLHQMVEMDYIGVVEWTSHDVCRYHYFIRSIETRIETMREYSEAIEKRAGWQERKRQIFRKYMMFNKRNVHTLIEAKKQSLFEFKLNSMPDAIRIYINGIPAWIKERMEVVTGDLVQVEKILKLKEEKVSIEVESLYKYDPAVTLGEFALIGYISDFTTVDTGFNKKAAWKTVGVLGLVLTLFALGFYYFISYQNRKEQKDHEAYFTFLSNNTGVRIRGDQVQFDTAKIYTVRLYDPLILSREVGYTKVLFGGGYWNYGVGAKPIFRVLLSDSTYVADSPQIPKRSSRDESYYGDVQIPDAALGREMPKTMEGLNGYKPIMITVLRTGPDWMTYKIAK